MNNIIDLSVQRTARERPDPSLGAADEYGRRLGRYALSYRMGGGRLALDILAYSVEDAEARVAAMRDSLVMDGEIYGVQADV